MRIATWNIEWFTNLFDDKDRLLLDDGWSARRDITRRQQLESIAIVLTAMNAMRSGSSKRPTRTATATP